MRTRLFMERNQIVMRVAGLFFSRPLCNRVDGAVSPLRRFLWTLSWGFPPGCPISFSSAFLFFSSFFPPFFFFCFCKRLARFLVNIWIPNEVNLVWDGPWHACFRGKNGADSLPSRWEGLGQLERRALYFLVGGGARCLDLCLLQLIACMWW